MASNSAATAAKVSKALGWGALKELCKVPLSLSPGSLKNGPSSSYARLRLFGKQENNVRVTLFRDNHAWCPYCEKIWFFLEEKRIPYKIEKVTMFCYGEKEKWYKRKVPSGMLPAIEIDGKVVTESDDILVVLENEFGPLYKGMHDPDVKSLRQLERYLFRAWCNWLCYPASNQHDEVRNQAQFVQVAEVVDKTLSKSKCNYFLDEFSVVDCIFTPYVERMNASLYYYKGFKLRDKERFPHIFNWFNGLEERETYRGMQSDFHTHAHDLPPQMGGCYTNGSLKAEQAKKHVDEGPWATLADSLCPDVGDGEQSKSFALSRVLLHRESICSANPLGEGFDEPLRCALTYMMTGKIVLPPNARNGKDVSSGLRYLRDRINVPRDMPIWSARHFRNALEVTAKGIGPISQGSHIPLKHRRDQNPVSFFEAKPKKGLFRGLF